MERGQAEMRLEKEEAGMGWKGDKQELGERTSRNPYDKN